MVFPNKVRELHRERRLGGAGSRVLLQPLPEPDKNNPERLHKGRKNPGV